MGRSLQEVKDRPVYLPEVKVPVKQTLTVNISTAKPRVLPTSEEDKVTDSLVASSSIGDKTMVVPFVTDYDKKALSISVTNMHISEYLTWCINQIESSYLTKFIHPSPGYSITKLLTCLHINSTHICCYVIAYDSNLMATLIAHFYDTATKTSYVERIGQKLAATDRYRTVNPSVNRLLSLLDKLETIEDVNFIEYGDNVPLPVAMIEVL